MQDKERGLNAYTLVMDRFKDIPEEVACKALKILNGLKLQETNSDKLFIDSYNREQMVVGGKRYAIKAIYGYMQSTIHSGGKDPLDVHMSMKLKIYRETSYGFLQTVLNFTVRFLGTKEEAMKKVDFR
jgi:hypothetical protein